MGRILGQCTFGAKILYCTWLTLATESDNFICVPMKPLPTDKNEDEAKTFIKENILGKTNEEISRVL